jgi:hypothetical protein
VFFSGYGRIVLGPRAGWRDKNGEDTTDRLSETEKIFNRAADSPQPLLGQSAAKLESEKIPRKLVANSVKYLPTAQ